MFYSVEKDSITQFTITQEVLVSLKIFVLFNTFIFPFF